MYAKFAKNHKFIQGVGELMLSQVCKNRLQGKSFSQSASTTENVIDRARNWAKCVRENSKTDLLGWKVE